MNSLKNLMIIAVLAAVGYGVYVSLARNNAEPGTPPVAAEGWPAMPKVELSGMTKTSPLPLGGNPARPVGSPNLGAGGLASSFAPPAPTLPPTGSSALPSGNPLAGAPPMVPVAPYPSSSALPVPLASSPSAPPPSPMATLGAPMSPDALATMGPANPAVSNFAAAPSSDMVRNLAPPPSLPTPSQGMDSFAPPIDSAENYSVAPPAGSPADNLLQSKFAAFMEAVQKKLDEGKFAEAHLALSTLYGNADLPADQAKQITELLDQLAGTVIYSRKHYLEPPYMTQPGDTFDKIAQKYSIPWLLLARINGMAPAGGSNVDNPAKDQPLPVGTELKVVRGPFEAVVRLDRHELTLMLQNRYAGRFPIGVGRDQPKLDGSYTVCDKTLNPTYYGPDGININPNDPRNPLGSAWIGLTDRIGIHGTGDPQGVGRDDNRGTLCVGDRDLQDLYGILSVGSRVTVMR